MPATKWFRRNWVPYAVLGVAIAVTLLGTYYVIRTGRARDTVRFQIAVEETRHLIEIRIQTYIEVLRASVALFGASDDVTRQEFSAFVSGLRLPERYPGIQGIGFLAHLTRNKVGGVRGARDEYTSVLFIEPLDDRNRRALGFDMGSDPIRRAAMDGARDTGEPAASGKVTLVQDVGDADAQPGFLIYVPVFANGLATGTVEERRAALRGHVFSQFRVQDLLSGILGEGHGAMLELTVYDGAGPDAAALMHASTDDFPPTPHEHLRTTQRLDVAGRPWTFEFKGQPHFDGASSMWLGPLTLGGGLLISLALFAILASQDRARHAAEKHTAKLRASEEALREGETRLRRLVVLEREARAEAQAADRAKDEFLATLSHELRTPLNAMLGWINLLRAGKVREDRRAGAMEVIERNARTQARLIEDLLDVSRIITGKVRLELHPLRVGPIAHTAVEGLRPAADAKGIRVQTVIHPEIPDIMGDAARLQQILWNLLSNAIKFTPPGGQVIVELKSDEGEVELSVRDTGLGIAADFLPHVFERFRQADSSTTRPHSGVGLGLAIVRHLVELHGGRISAHSEGENRGALFVVRLPLAARAAATGTDAHRPKGVPLQGVRVLIVDDDSDTLEMLSEALEASGAEVSAARSADEALVVLNNGGIDVLVSDIGMPNVDGYALIRRVRALPGSRGRIPAIALTAYARPEDRAEAIDAGFQLHLPKPVEIDMLQASLASLAARTHG